MKCDFPIGGNDTAYMEKLVLTGNNRTDEQDKQLQCYMDVLSEPDGLIYSFTPNADTG